MFNWIPEVDNDCRMWKCPVCGVRNIGQPLGWHQNCPYFYCYHCGTQNSDFDPGDPDNLPGSPSEYQFSMFAYEM